MLYARRLKIQLNTALKNLGKEMTDNEATTSGYNSIYQNFSFLGREFANTQAISDNSQHSLNVIGKNSTINCNNSVIHVYSILYLNFRTLLVNNSSIISNSHRESLNINVYFIFIKDKLRAYYC